MRVKEIRQIYRIAGKNPVRVQLASTSDSVSTTLTTIEEYEEHKVQLLARLQYEKSISRCELEEKKAQMRKWMKENPVDCSTKIH